MLKRLSAAFAATLVVACVSSPPVPNGMARPATGAASPSLPEIFLEPSLAGVGPSIRGLSPDGEWLLFDWSGTAAESSDRKPRLMRVARPQDTGFRGTPLDELVPSFFGESGPLRRVAWLKHGARLVMARGRQVLIHEADTGETRLLVREADPVPEPAEDPHVRFAGAIRRLDVLERGTVLEILDSKESYRLPLAPEFPTETWLLDELEHTSDDLDAAPIDLAFNNDGSIVFGARRSPVQPPTDDEAEEARPPFHVYHRTEERGVTLSGFDPDVHSRWTMSQDGRYVFAVERDRSSTPESTIVPDYLTDRVTTRKTRRMLADDGPEPVRFWVWDTSTGVRKSFFRDEEWRDVWVRSIAWGKQDQPELPARLVLVTLSADHKHREVHLWTEGFRETVFEDTDERWNGGPIGRVIWQDEGQGLILGSECHASLTTPGHAQVFHVRADDGLVTQLTEVEGEVSDFRIAHDGSLAITAIRDDPAHKWIGWIDTAVLASDPPKSDGLRWFEQPAGFNATLRPGRWASVAVFTHERMFQPPEIWFADAEGSARLTRTTPRAFDEQRWVHPERIDVTARDGSRLRAHVFVPPAWSDGDEARATIVFVHGAGYLQNVTESMTEYPLNLMFHSRLASMGYPVIDVDYRGSAGYGGAFRTDLQYHLGGLDLTDIHDVVDHQIARGLVDAERVGIYGGSYGGFMAMMALFTAPERWSVGCALRSVTDWRTYHPGYTQPRLGRPSTHPEAYRRSSPIDLVDGLEDPLLVLHGMLDTNVFAQDSIRLIEELIDRGKEFDAMLYPSQGHGFHDGPHWLDEYRRIETYLLENLGSPVRSEGRP